PLIGCGTYANRFGAASCTGDGEAIIRLVMGKSAVDSLGAEVNPDASAARAIAALHQLNGTGGIILIDHLGKLGYACNTTHMPVCAICEGAVTAFSCSGDSSLAR